MREVIKQASTIEEAIELALSELNLTKEQVTYEVLEYPEKRFFFKKPAKVKVCEIEEEFDVKTLFEDKKVKKEKPAKVEKTVKEEKPVKVEKEVKEQKVCETVKEEQPVKAEKQEVKQTEEKTEAIREEVAPQDYTPKVKYSIEFINSVIGQFYQNEYSFKVYATQTGYIIKIVGDDAGCLIGRKGETMEAISYLTSLAANRFEDSDEKISVDVADYRQKREKDLQQLAKKMAIKVAKSGRSYSFEPMNPYERRIIHSTVGEMTGVKSESKGEGNQRRVIIYSTSPRKPRTNGGRNNNRRGGNREKRENQPEVAQKTRETKLVDNAGTSLYSKIEL